MDVDSQDLAAMGVLAIAALYLLRRAWRIIIGRNAGGCTACPSCPSDSLPEEKPLVTIDDLTESARPHK